MCGSTLCNILLLRFLIVRCIEKKSLFIFRWNSKSLFPLFFLLHGIGDFIFSILKVTTKNSSLGNDLPVTVVVYTLACFFFTGFVLYYMVLLNFLQGYTRMMNPISRKKVENFFSLSKKLAWLVLLPVFILGIGVVVGLKYSEYRVIFAMIYLVGGGVCILTFGSLWFLTFGFLIKEMANHIKDSIGSMDDIKVVYLRLKAAYYVGSTLFALIAVLYITFGSWSYLRIRSDYAILIIQITVHPTATILVLTVSHINRPAQPSPDFNIDKPHDIECNADSTGHEITLTKGTPPASIPYLESLQLRRNSLLKVSPTLNPMG
jgi:hypothetical protein